MMEEGEKIIRIDINDEMKSAYIDYSMSVIVARALPDVRDGFKPVHRRILFGMNELGNTSDKPHKKSARIVGEVLGKYHPHGDSSVYFAMIRMAQDWIMRYTLVDGQGNLGSMDGDSPAAMRYTEARLSKMGEEMLKDIEKDTVDFQFNFDDTLQEPSVLPARIPNLLVNGCSGIAVGMATNMPTHNLSEVVDGCIAYIDNNDIDTAGLMKYIKAPDFPTGAYIYGISGVKEAYETGKGRVVMRAKAEIDTSGTHEKIIVREIPYAANKAELIKSIADMVTDNRLDGISNINDESTEREGVRIVIDIKKDANSNVVLNTLYKETPLQSSFGVNNIALVKGRPCQLSLKKLIELFIEHRHDVIVRRTAFELKEAEKRAHLLLGLIIASDNIDEVVRIIRSSQTPDEAIESLMNRFELDKVQARFIVEMRLRQLTATAQRDLRSEYEELMKTIEHLKEILGSKELQMQIIKEELLEIKERYGDKRKSEIMYSAEDFDPEDFYANEEMVVTISHLGYIKRTPLTEYRVQKRGGLGSKGSVTREEDFIEYIYSAFMHSTMLFFTQNGHCYWLKVYDIPEGGKNSKGRAIQNILNIESGDKVNTCLAINQLQEEEFNTSHFLVFCTKNGIIKKTSLSSYAKPRANGIIALKLREEDQLINVLLTDGKQEIIIANRNGYAIRFNEDKVRDMGKNSIGVNAIKLDKEDAQDEVVGMITISDVEKETILVLSEEGYGKRSDIEDYRMTNRAGKGVRTINITEKTGKLIAIQSVREEDNLMIINQSGITIRMKVSDVRVMGRNTQGVKLINLDKNGDTIAAVCVVNAEAEEDIPTLDLDTTQQENNTTGNNQ